MASPSPHKNHTDTLEGEGGLASAWEPRERQAAPPIQRNSPTKLQAPRCPHKPVFTPICEDDENSFTGDQENQSKQRVVGIIGQESEDGVEKQSPMIAMRTPSGLFTRSLIASSSSMEHDSHTKYVASSQSQMNSPITPFHPSSANRTPRIRACNTSTVSCDMCKPLSINTQSPAVAPLTELRDIIGLPSKDPNGKFQLKSWFSPLTKKTPKKKTNRPNKEVQPISPNIMEDWDITIEGLNQKLIQASIRRDSALMEVRQLRTSMGEMQKQMKKLELYCQDLKYALNRTEDGIAISQGSSLNEHGFAMKIHNHKAITYEAMVEPFLQAVAESRVAVRRLCKTIAILMQEQCDGKGIEKLSSLLQPYEVDVSQRISRVVMYYLEALLNQAFYEDFESCNFKKNGARMVLDPYETCAVNFSCFTSLRNLGWDEVLSKGTRFFSESFSEFCDQKMSLIMYMLNWTNTWPEQLLQEFFIAAKNVWLVHLLAFSFHPPLPVFRVDKLTDFDSVYMEDILHAGMRQTKQVPVRVRIMVMPGFYVHNNVIKCKVLCRYMS